LRRTKLRLGQALVIGLSACATLSFASCQKKPAAPPVKAAAVAPDPNALPVVDAPRLKARMAPEQTLQVVDFPRDGETQIAGKVEGWRAPVYAVPVAAGQTLSVELEAKSKALYVNVGDAADTTGAALHRGEVDGPKALIKVERAGVYFVAPYQPRAMARRAETADFTLVIGRGPTQ
jgi:hypothetical protein